MLGELHLGRIIGTGGEGVVWDVLGSETLAAKIYHIENRTAEIALKLSAMIAKPPVDSARSLTPPHISIAWPIDLIYERGQVAGFLMPRVAECPDVYKIFNPQLRAREFPDFDWKHLHHAAKNIAAGMAALHLSGHVMGDVNQKNLMVAKDSLATLVDTDSYQIKAADGRIFRCGVGVPDYTPPELQSVDLRTVDRLPSHDCFGLAVMIFQLLMEGFHPFTGAPKDPDLSVGGAIYLYCIKNGIFPYVANSLIAPPPGAPLFDALYPELQALFERSFVKGHTNPAARPSAAEWMAALERAEDDLRVCTINPRHFNASHVGICQWCEREWTNKLLGVPSATPAAISPTIPVEVVASHRPVLAQSALLKMVGWISVTALLLFIGVRIVDTFAPAQKIVDRDSVEAMTPGDEIAKEHSGEAPLLHENGDLPRAENVNNQTRRIAPNRSDVPADPATEHSGAAPTVSIQLNPTNHSITVMLPKGVRLDLVRIPEGTFQMGSPESEAGRGSDEPRHAVRISQPFYLSEFCVTQEQFDAVMDYNPSFFKNYSRSEKRPVESVTWTEADTFCDKLSLMTGTLFHLPNEAQWEYACRAGVSSTFSVGATIDSERANIRSELTGISRGEPMPVGSFLPNGFGLYDMHGNVFEWCHDWYSENFYNESPYLDPFGPQSGTTRVLRGGSYAFPPANCRSAARLNLAPSAKNKDIGFRIAATIDVLRKSRPLQSRARQ